MKSQQNRIELVARPVVHLLIVADEITDPLVKDVEVCVQEFGVDSYVGVLSQHRLPQGQRFVKIRLRRQ